MLHHRAFGRHLDTLTIAVINRWPILSLMLAMLAAIGAGRIETYESPAEAIDAMAKDVPDIVIAAASMQPVTGPALVKSMRRASAGPVSLVPTMMPSRPWSSNRSGRGRIRCSCCQPPRARSTAASTG
jgi:hypothetical protein